jgi:hypothetical protein
MKPVSAIGVSCTRSLPNSSIRPRVLPNTPPIGAMSSRITNTLRWLTIARAMAEAIASSFDRVAVWLIVSLTGVIWGLAVMRRRVRARRPGPGSRLAKSMDSPTSFCAVQDHLILRFSEIAGLEQARDRILDEKAVLRFGR